MHTCNCAHVSFLFSLIDVTFLRPDGVVAMHRDAAACVGAGGKKKLNAHAINMATRTHTVFRLIKTALAYDDAVP